MRLALALVAVLLLAASAEAAERPRLRDTGVRALASPLISDGERYVVAPTPRGELLIDALNGRRRLVSRPCVSCVLTDVGGGAVLWTGDDDVARILDIASGTMTTLPSMSGEPNASGPERTFWTAIGRRWVRARVSGYHYHYFRHVDRRTGAVAPQHDQTYREIPDLDSERLWRPLCSPLRVPAQPDGELGDPEPADLTYRHPYTAGLAYNEDLQPVGPLFTRCGHPMRRLAGCPGRGCVDPALGPGVLAWQRRDGRFAARRLPRGRTRTWPIYSPYFAVTRDRVWVVDWQPNGPGPLRTAALR